MTFRRPALGLGLSLCVGVGLFAAPVTATAAAIEDVKITPAALAAAGCRPSDGEHAVSPQARMLYPMVTGTFASMLTPPRRKEMQSVACPDGNGTAYYYEYATPTEVGSALGFVRPLIWGGSGPTPLHPELIQNEQNVLVVLSGPHPETLVKLVRRAAPGPAAAPVAVASPGATAAAPAAPGLAVATGPAPGGGHRIGAGLVVPFAPTLEIKDFPMPHGTANLRAYGQDFKLGVTGIPTNAPRASADFVAKQLMQGVARTLNQPEASLPPPTRFTTPKVNAAYASFCARDGAAKFQVFKDAAFTCQTSMVMSADTMVFIVSIGSESLASPELASALGALKAVH